MKLKPGLIAFGLKPEMLLGLMVVQAVWEEAGESLTLTDINSGKHSLTSLHNCGYAVDIRTRDLVNFSPREMADKLNEALGHSVDYDVVVEDTHIHFEYQPKRRD